MNVPQSDALVFFGATGDLVFKKIFPALYAMERRAETVTAGICGCDSPVWLLSQGKDALSRS